ncbi:hypothetical protein C0092_13560 [Mycobacterium tuberculosis]|nr:hypothetical protein C0092_13560 [Mycobacterium tuberculosis]
MTPSFPRTGVSGHAGAVHQWRFEHLLIPFLVALAQLRWHRVIPRTAHAYAECYSPRPHRHLPG